MKLTPQDGSGGDKFGSSVALSGSAAIIGAPLRDTVIPVINDTGAAYIFRETGGVWTEEAQLVASNGIISERLGLAVGIDGGLAVMGSPFSSSNTGRAVSFVHSPLSGTWGENREFVSTDTATGLFFAQSVAVSGDFIAAGANRFSNVSGTIGSGYVFDTFSDCDGNGISDVQDITSGAGADCNENCILDSCDIAAATSPDCNANGIPDECDIASGFSSDCNNNSIPDECDIVTGTSADCNTNGRPDECDIFHQVDVAFIIDGSTSVGANAFQLELQGIINCLCGPNAVVTADGKYSVAVIQFTGSQIVEIPRTVLDSPATVQSVCTLVGNITLDSGGTTLNPALLEAMTIFNQGFGDVRNLMISTDGGLSDFGASESTCSNLRNMSPPVKICTAMVGNSSCPTTGTAFAFMQDCANTPLSFTFNPNEPVGSYNCIITANEYDPLCATCFPFFGGSSLDCNENGIPDECDRDCNSNGVPDTCESFCMADITPPGGNCTVNIDDLVAVLTGFGPCSAPPALCSADITPPGGNGVVNIDDLVMVLTEFGPCGSEPASGGINGITLEAMDFSNGWMDENGVIDTASAALVAGEWLTYQNQWDVYRLWATVDDQNSTLTFAGGGVASGVGGISEPLVLSPGKNATFNFPNASYSQGVHVGLLAIDGGPGYEMFQTQAFGTYLLMGSASGAGPMLLGDTTALNGLLTGTVNDPNTGWGVLASPGLGVVSDGNGGWRVLIGQFAVLEGNTFTAAVRLVGDEVDTYATVNSGTPLP